MSFRKGKSQKMKKSTKVFKVTDPSKNVYGFKVDTAGISTEAFLLNPVCLLNHNYDKIMGSWTDLALAGKGMTAIPVFDEADPEAVNMCSKVEQDLLKGASIGIIPLAVKDGVIIKSELLEISLTPVPANRSALVLYNTKGVALSVEEAKTYCLSIQDTKSVENLQKNIMNKELLAALVMLCAQAGLTVQLSADAKDEEIANAITNVGNKINALTLSANELKVKVDAFETAKAVQLKVEGETLVDAAITAKKISADKRESFLKLHTADPELCKSTLEGLTAVTLSVIPGAKEAAAANKDETDKATWNLQAWLEKDGAGLSAMQTTEPEKFQKLYAEYQVELKGKGIIA